MRNKEIKFDFQKEMKVKEKENDFSLDEHQKYIVSRLDALISSFFYPIKIKKNFDGVYIWGKVGRGKTFILDAFFNGVPIKNKIRVHFHSFFRELHQSITIHNKTKNPMKSALNERLGNCKLLCFDEFHLHDIGDAMLIKPVLDFVFQNGIILVATSNYSPDELLSNPLYHERFIPSINLIKLHMEVIALSGDKDYRLLGNNKNTPFSQGVYLCPGSAEQRREHGLPVPNYSPISLAVGYRTLNVLSPAENFLHFSFSDLCIAPTAVMDYLQLCEKYSCWVIEKVPMLGKLSPAIQQRFINVIDVLYDQNCRLFLLSEYELSEIVFGVEQQDIQRTRSRLSQLNKDILQRNKNYYELSEY